MEPSISDLETLKHSIENRAQRALLIRQIDALIAVRRHEKVADPVAAPEQASAAAAPVAQGRGDAMVASLAHAARLLAASIAHLFSPGPFLALIAWFQSLLNDPQSQSLWGFGAAIVVASLVAGFAAERLLTASLSRLRQRLAPRPSRPPLVAVLSAVTDSLARTAPVAAFLIAGYAVLSLGLAWRGPFGDPYGAIRGLTIAMLDARAIIAALTGVSETLLTHVRAREHAPRAHSETLGYWLIWLVRIARLLIYGWFGLWFWREMGLPPSLYDFATKILGLVLVGLAIMLILQNRASVARLIRGRHRGELTSFDRLRAWLADSWHFGAILYLLAGYFVWAIGVVGGLAFLVSASVWSAVILVAARFAIFAGRYASDRLLEVGPLFGARLPGLQTRAMRYASVLVDIVRGLISVTAGILLLQVWGVGVLGWMATDGGRRVTTAAITIAVTAGAAILAWEVISLLIEAYLSRAMADGVPVERSARMRTILPLVRKTTSGVLAALVILVGLSELGVNVAPLLAGAGIVGIAVGFGAQTLVKDVITGLFILMQDAVSVGDVVKVAGCSGLVEQISIRSIRLRGLDGTVVFVPFSEVTTVQNMTKEFSYAVFDIGIGYRENVDDVIEVVRELGNELQQDEEFRWRILERIEILGLDRFGDSAVIIKARIKTRPSQQWTIMREFNLRTKRRFDELDIEIPFPHQTIYFGAGKNGEAAPAHVAVERLAAAHAEAEERRTVSERQDR